MFGRLDDAIKRRSAAYRESRGIDLFERTDKSLPAPEYGKDYQYFQDAGYIPRPGVKGLTTPHGQAFVNKGLEGEELIVTARHEVFGHRTLVPDAADFLEPVLTRGDPLTRMQAARHWLLENSRSVKFLDELRAHAIATGDTTKGVLYAVDRHLDSGRMLLEAAGVAGAGTATYGAVKLVTADGQTTESGK